MRAELKKRYLILALVGLSSFAADQITKIWARGALRSPTARRYIDDSEDEKKNIISVIDKRVEFRLSFNKGAAFGMFAEAEGGRWWLIIVGVLAMGLIFYLLHRPEAESKLFLVALSLVTGGAIGNLWDRIFHGEVTDFIVVWLTKSISLTWPWPAFNVADAVLVIGVGLMMIHILVTWRDEQSTEDKKSGDGPTKSENQAKNPGDGPTKSENQSKNPGDGPTKSGNQAKNPGDGPTKSRNQAKNPGDGPTKSGNQAKNPGDGPTKSGNQPEKKSKDKKSDKNRGTDPKNK